MEERITEVKSTDTKESEQSSGEHPTGMSRKEGLQGRDRKVEAKKVSESWRSNEEADEAFRSHCIVLRFRSGESQK